MRIQIITSCTGVKKYSPNTQLIQDDFKHLHEFNAFSALEENLKSYRTPAAELYAGSQHIRLLEGVNYFKENWPEAEINLWILSAGYGLISEDRLIVPYECTFQGMKAKEIQTWSAFLKIPDDVRRFFMQTADLTIVLLSDSYLRALALDSNVQYESPTLFLTSKSTNKYILGRGRYRSLILQVADTKRFSCGLVGLKGEIVKRLLYFLSTRQALSTEFFSQEDAKLLDVLQTIDL